jgi:hypothetical protein
LAHCSGSFTDLACNLQEAERQVTAERATDPAQHLLLAAAFNAAGGAEGRQALAAYERQHQPLAPHQWQQHPREQYGTALQIPLAPTADSPAAPPPSPHPEPSAGGYASFRPSSPPPSSSPPLSSPPLSSPPMSSPKSRARLRLAWELAQQRAETDTDTETGTNTDTFRPQGELERRRDSPGGGGRWSGAGGGGRAAAGGEHEHAIECAMLLREVAAARQAQRLAERHCAQERQARVAEAHEAERRLARAEALAGTQVEQLQAQAQAAEWRAAAHREQLEAVTPEMAEVASRAAGVEGRARAEREEVGLPLWHARGFRKTRSRPA